jgi:hypothetical protein
LDIDAKPFETSVKRLEITCCEYAHICIKKQACSQRFGFVVWLEANFKSTMHSSNVGSGAHVNEVC